MDFHSMIRKQLLTVLGQDRPRYSSGDREFALYITAGIKIDPEKRSQNTFLILKIAPKMSS